MLPLGLKKRELRRLNALLRSNHRIFVRCQVLDLEHNYLADVSRRLVEGQVNIDADAEVTRSLDIVLKDPNHTLHLDSDSPEDGSLYMDRMMRIVYSVGEIVDNVDVQPLDLPEPIVLCDAGEFIGGAIKANPDSIRDPWLLTFNFRKITVAQNWHLAAVVQNSDGTYYTDSVHVGYPIPAGESFQILDRGWAPTNGGTPVGLWAAAGANLNSNNFGKHDPANCWYYYGPKWYNDPSSSLDTPGGPLSGPPPTNPYDSRTVVSHKVDQIGVSHDLDVNLVLPNGSKVALPDVTTDDGSGTGPGTEVTLGDYSAEDIGVEFIDNTAGQTWTYPNAEHIRRSPIEGIESRGEFTGFRYELDDLGGGGSGGGPVASFHYADIDYIKVERWPRYDPVTQPGYENLYVYKMTIKGTRKNGGTSLSIEGDGVWFRDASNALVFSGVGPPKNANDPYYEEGSGYAYDLGIAEGPFTAVLYGNGTYADPYREPVGVGLRFLGTTVFDTPSNTYLYEPKNYNPAPPHPNGHGGLTIPKYGWFYAGERIAVGDHPDLAGSGTPVTLGEPGPAYVADGDFNDVIFDVKEFQPAQEEADPPSEQPDSEWFDIPVFCGPITKLERTDTLISIEAQGKETMAFASMWRTKTFKEGLTKTTVIKRVFERILGENKISVPDKKERIPRKLSLGVTSSPWKVCKRLARSMGFLLFYDGRGRLRMKPRGGRSVLRFTDKMIKTMPQISYDTENVRNAVLVIGAKPEGSNKRIRVRRVAGKKHPLSPTRLGRNGKKRFIPEVIKDDSIRSHSEARRVARKTLRIGLLESVDVAMDTLVYPHLEEMDICKLDIPEYSMEFPLRKMTIPLTADGTSSIGYIKRTSPKRRAIRGRKRK